MANAFLPRLGRGNRILSLLPPDESRRLQPHLTPVELEFRKVLHRAHKPVVHVYFPTRGVASAVTILESGAMIEVGNVGNEGVIGSAAFLGPSSSPHEVFMQVAGEGFRMDAAELVRQTSGNGPLRRVLTAYHTYFFSQVSQSVACNGLHGVAQRCCRWLLMAHDRVETDELSLTHETLAMMLGVRRASVTLVLQPLQDQGLIRCHRGAITVLDRSGLEVAACECYQAVRDEYARLLPGLPAAG